MTVAGALGAVFRHELRLLLYSPLTYIFQFAFLVALAACVFLIADIYATDEASIRPMLVFLPWVALILVPALAMRAWLGDHADRGLELMLTLPIPVHAVVAGKFLAGYVVLLATLIFTMPLVATLYYLGEPDPGVWISGYLGAALLLGATYAIALFAAALSREPVGAFVIGVALLFVLLLLGWDVMGRLLGDRAPAPLLEALTAYSPKTWLDSMGRGLVEFAAVAYFALVTAAALLATGMVIDARRRVGWSLRRGFRGALSALAVLGLLAIAIPAARDIPLALDLTGEREFTLHDGTLRVVERLPPGVEVTLYWSASETSVPAAIKSHARRVADLLRNLASRAAGRLTIKTVDPRPDTDPELQATADGLRRVPMSSGDSFYLGATFRHGERIGAIPYFDIRRDRFLEYDMAVALHGLSRTETPRLGVLSPLLPPAEEPDGLTFMAELKRAYDIAVIPHFSEALPEGLDVLLVIDATILRREMLYAIDQFVMRGGGLIVLMDPYLRFDRASNVVNPEPSAEINDISDLLQGYGVRYLGESVVGDALAASVVADQQQSSMSFPFWMRIRGDGLSPLHPVTADLNEVMMVEPGSLDIGDAGRATSLITTSEQSGARPRRDFADLTPRELAAGFAPDGRRRTVAAALRGPFDSAFANPPEGRHRSRSTAEPVVFAVADVDWLFDPFSLQRVEVGDQVMVRPLNDNLTFLLNMVEYASGDAALIAIRSRGRLQRPFTRVAALFRAAEERFREKEAALAGRVVEIESQIDEIQAANALDREAGTFQAELLSARRELRAVRRRIREEIDRLGRRLTIVNLLAGPALVLLFAGAVFGWQRRRA